MCHAQGLRLMRSRCVGRDAMEGVGGGVGVAVAQPLKKARVVRNAVKRVVRAAVARRGRREAGGRGEPGEEESERAIGLYRHRGGWGGGKKGEGDAGAVGSELEPDFLPRRHGGTEVACGGERAEEKEE